MPAVAAAYALSPSTIECIRQSARRAKRLVSGVQRGDAMRILLVAHAFPPTFGGVETHVWDISQRLAERGHDILCLVGGDPTTEIFNSVEVQRSPLLSVGYLLTQRKCLHPTRLNNALRESLRSIVGSVAARFRPQLVHAHNAHHFAPELALALFDETGEASLVNSVHDRVGEHVYPSVLAFPWSHTLYASHYLSRCLPSPTPSTVLWLGIDLTSFGLRNDCDERFADLERPIIFHPARLLRWKGVEVGLHAFVQLRKQLGSGTLILCASERIVDDPADVRHLRNALETTARAAGIDHRVIFLEFTRADIGAAYRASDLVWYPTIDEEPLGLVPIEAMASGVPLVVTASGGMLETVEHQQTGWVVPKGDVSALASAAKLLLTDVALRGRLTMAARAKARMFDIRAYVHALERVYEIARYGVQT
jgi:glycosyltransferase involved in cell wall biosynthesis